MLEQVRKNTTTCTPQFVFLQSQGQRNYIQPIRNWDLVSLVLGPYSQMLATFYEVAEG